MELFGRHFTKNELLKRVGDITQLAGLRYYELIDGVSRGIRAVDMTSPSGLDVTVLVDRGMDIGRFSYMSVPLCWRSATRETSPVYFESKGTGWLRTFHGGLLTTCGISYMGMPCIDNGEELGLHGRISNISAENIVLDGQWDQDSYVQKVQGKVREAKVFGANLELTRTITTWIDRPQLLIEDTVENIGWRDTPHMISYHMNFGFPLVDSNTQLLEPKAEVVPFDEESRKNLDRYDSFSEPAEGFHEQIFLHDVEKDNDGNCNIALVNRDFNRGQGIGVWLQYNKESLPNLVHWKQMGEGEYVCGLEPANTSIRGRKQEKEDNNVVFLSPGEKKHYMLSITVLPSNAEIAGVEEIVRGT